MLIPKTRKEIYQVYLSGDTDLELPKPVTRDEIILYNACINGAGVPPAGGGGGVFVVTLSGSAASGITVDKTYSEIKAAHDDGNFPVFSFRGRQIFQSYFFSGSDFQICSVSYMSGATATITTIIISSDDTVTMNMATFNVTPM